MSTGEEKKAEHDEKRPRPNLLPVYPGLVFREFLVVLLALLVLCWAGLLLEAPLGAHADPEFTPNPAKAPWYFLGFQELLVHFDPWLAGVVIPLLAVVGLAVIPLLDNNPGGADRYSFWRRRWATVPFTFGMVFLVALTIAATWFRGPNWDWYWPWENWAMARPSRLGFHSLPSLLGGFLLLGYYIAGVALAYRLWPGRLAAWGRVRTLVYLFFVLTMVGVAIKVLTRLLFNVRYLVQTPWFNI